MLQVFFSINQIETVKDLFNCASALFEVADYSASSSSALISLEAV